jgi:hypothetical protein
MVLGPSQHFYFHLFLHPISHHIRIGLAVFLLESLSFPSAISGLPYPTVARAHRTAPHQGSSVTAQTTTCATASKLLAANSMPYLTAPLSL